jgi:transposase InsO family protein
MTPDGGRITRGQESLHMQRQGGLWITSIGQVQATALLAGPIITSGTPLAQEHHRLGHIGRAKLLELAKEGSLSIGYKQAAADSFRTTDCTACQEHKMPRFPKTAHRPRGTRDGELIHVDITGPFKPSLTGADHLIEMIDDYSRVCSIVPMIGKTQAFKALQAFIAKIERQLGQKVRFIRSDNGGEFTSTIASEWYLKKGIIHQTSTPYTPELNGTIERLKRTFKEMIATMIAEAGLGQDYWTMLQGTQQRSS